MPFKDTEKQKKYHQEYYKKNKDKWDKDRTEYNKKYYQLNKEKSKKTKQTPQYKKQSRIYKWKKRGILCFDWDLLYDLYINTTHCEYCNCELTIDRYHQSTTRCLDHDHTITDKFNVRGVLCHNCNIRDVLIN